MVKELLTKRILNLKFLFEQKDKIEDFYTLLLEAVLNNNRIFLCGDGEIGSFLNNLALNLASDFKKIKNEVKIISLNSNDNLISSIATGTCFDDIFKKQIENSGKANDILVAFFPNAANKNIIEALKQAKFQNMKVILLTGKTKMDCNVDLQINTPSKNEKQINEMHTIIGHLVLELIEKNFN